MRNIIKNSRDQVADGNDNMLSTRHRFRHRIRKGWKTIFPCFPVLMHFPCAIFKNMFTIFDINESHNILIHSNFDGIFPVATFVICILILSRRENASHKLFVPFANCNLTIAYRSFVTIILFSTLSFYECAMASRMFPAKVHFHELKIQIEYWL